MSGDRHWRAAPAASVVWNSGEVPGSDTFEDVYYSAESGLAESRHVFLRGNNLPQRWAEGGQQAFLVLETGFGSGLNFLATREAWRAASAPPPLHYIAVEKYPMRHADLRRALAHWHSLQPLAQELLAAYPAALPGRHRLVFESGRVVLDLVLADIDDALAEQRQLQTRPIDAWFLDGFAPARNPDMWGEALFEHMAALSRPGTTFATFTAAGIVRRGLQAAGFNVEKVAGFGRKRDMTRGHYAGQVKHTPHRLTPWHLEPPLAAGSRSALVVGAGLAGATVASALARRGWTVTVLERGTVATGASGNPQGVLYTRLSHRESALNSFSLHSYLFALRLYADLFRRDALREGIDGSFCGALHLREAPADDHPLWDTWRSLPEMVRYLDREQAEAFSGLSGCPGGLLFRGAGWLHPAAVCHALLSDPAISLQQQVGAVTLEADDSGWSARDSDGARLATAPVAVVASGIAAGEQAELAWLPLQSVRGQVTEMPASAASRQLRTVICHEGYLPPATDGHHCIGATFDIGDSETAQRSADHARNIEALEAALPGFTPGELQPSDLSGRVGFRCASPDYLPIAGPVPDRPRFLDDYAQLRRNARRPRQQRGSFLPGLYVSTAHGSRGLTSTPLCAELLASRIDDGVPPLDTSLWRALAPARFLVRDLARNRT